MRCGEKVTDEKNEEYEGATYCGKDRGGTVAYTSPVTRGVKCSNIQGGDERERERETKEWMGTPRVQLVGVQSVGNVCGGRGTTTIDEGDGDMPT